MDEVGLDKGMGMMDSWMVLDQLGVAGDHIQTQVALEKQTGIRLKASFKKICTLLA